MQRRKLIAGLGSLAAGSAAAVGTGAVSTMRADRAYKVETAGDADAYVGLAGNDSSQFVSQSNGTLSLDFASDTEWGGEGVNMGVTEVRPAFTLENQGEETIYAQIENPLSNNDITTNAGGNAASEANVTIPAGVDFQFIAVPTGEANSISVGELGVIGRSEAPSNGPGFGSTTGQQTIRNSPGATAYRFADTAGHVELAPGESVDIIARVVATQEVEPPQVDFTVEAFTDSQYARGDALGL